MYNFIYIYTYTFICIDLLLMYIYRAFDEAEVFQMFALWCCGQFQICRQLLTSGQDLRIFVPCILRKLDRL